MKDFKLAICQTSTYDDKERNIEIAERMIDEAVSNGAQVVVLPEMFNTPYQNEFFPKYAEVYPGETSKRMMAAAKKHGIVLIAGSISEECDGKVYNTAYAFNENGELLGRHRKVHLFDIDVKGKVYFKESDTLTPGDDLTVFDTSYGRFGLAICYDVRFPELFREYALMGAEAIFLPAAFNMTTGPAHWELSIRMRALDNQVYMIGAAPARNPDTTYTAYGNSRVADPWGRVIAEGDETEMIVYADIEGQKIVDVRNQLPLLKHRREDLYELKFERK